MNNGSLPLLNQFLPLLVVAVMLALGLTLTVADFQRAATLKRPLAIALGCQAVLLPALCLLIAEAFDLQPNLAVGLMLMAAAPGGIIANLLSHLVNGDFALNLTLTAINAVLSIVTLPAILAIATTWFSGDGRFIPLPSEKLLAVFAVVLIPTAIGVAIRHRFPELAQRLQTPTKIAAAVLLVVATIATIIGARETIRHSLGVLSGAVVVFCLASLTVGYLAPRWMHLGPRQAIAVSLEIGIHNGVFAMGLALSPQLLNSAEIAIPAITYGVIAPFIAVMFIVTVRRLDPAFNVSRDPTKSLNEPPT